MSSGPDYNLSDQFYENSDKTIKMFKTRKHGTINYIAVKVYNKKYHPDRYNYEYNLIHKINHPNIVNVCSFSEDYNFYYMEMEFCATGDLSRCLWQNKKNRYGERTIKMISSQLLMGLQALHKNGIIHCNLKPSNILIDEYGNMRICDFKKSLRVATMNMKEIKKNKTAMTPCYTAPELFQDDGMYSFKTDFWALGCIMFELAVGEVPFFNEKIGSLISKIINEEVNFNRKELSNYSDDFVEVLKKLLDKDPNSRAGWGEIEKCSFWEGFLDDSSNIQGKETKVNKKQGIDALRLSKIAVKNAAEKKEDYNGTGLDGVSNADQEFDFQEKEDDNDGIDPFASATTGKNVSKKPLEISVLKISKVFKRDKRTYNDLHKDLTESSEEDMPKLETFFIHQTDRVIKPIIGNKAIEETTVTTYNKSRLPFTPWKIDMLKDMMNNPKDIKAVENYLYNIYTMLDSYVSKNDWENLLNLLKYFETIVFDRELANNLINTSFIQQFIQFLKNLNNDQVKIRCSCIVGYLIRYATIIEVPLDQYGFCDIICNIIVNSVNNEVMKKVTATLGEYLFYVATQEETPENQDWKISDKYINTLLFCLDGKRNETVKFYTIKTIENIAILTDVSKTYFAKNDSFISKIIDVYKTTKNIELKQSAISCASHLIRHQPSLIKVFLEKLNILADVKLFLNENATIQQSLINCLLYSVVLNSKNLSLILPKCDSFTGALLKILDKCNNIIRLKIILLLGFFLVDINLIEKYGDDLFAKMQKYRKEPNREIHVSVKFFERNFISGMGFFIKNWITLLQKDSKIDELIKYSKACIIIGSYHKISTSLYTQEFINSVVAYISNPKGKNETLISNMYDILLMFSENPICIDKNIDVLLQSLFVQFLNLATLPSSGDHKVHTITICANILTLILEDDRLYSSTVANEGKTKSINNLIKNITPILKNLLKEKEMTDSSLSLLSLILERDGNFVNLFNKEGIIDYVFKIMTMPSFLHNLSIIKILISLVESNEIGFNEIMKLGLIDKVNSLIPSETEIDNYVYMEFVMELLYDLITKLNEYRKKVFSNKIDKDTYKKNFSNKIEALAKNFKLCIRLIGEDKNVNLQEEGCACLIYFLQLFPDGYIESLKLNLKFTNEDIPNLIKGLELSCTKIHKYMIKIFVWIIQFQKDGEDILKPYVSYIITYLENICNTSADPSVIKHAQKLMNEDLAKYKKK